MKLPQKENDHDTYYTDLLKGAQQIAIRLTLRTDTPVKAMIIPIEPEGGWLSYDWSGDKYSQAPLRYELVFIAMGNKYQSLKEVKKALKLKAFL
jgi:hypothetical protein